MYRLLLILFALATLPSGGQSAPYYKVEPPPRVITEYRVESISIITRAEMELGKLPDHPKITWLGYSSIRLRNDWQGNMQTDNRIYFIANAPGVVEFPPIPIVLENKEFFVRIDELEVKRNTASKTATRLEVLWNESSEIPKQVHLGEAVEVQFIELVKYSENRFGGGASFSEPINRVIGGQWHQFTRVLGRKPIPSDYFFGYGRRSFFSSNVKNYLEINREIEGIDYDIRVYKARLYFTKVGLTRGNLSATLGTSRETSTRRTHLVPFEIEVLPVPPMPNDQAFDTGLVGDWHFETSYTPRQPQASKPLKISVSINGQGNPNLRNDFDFSADGFANVESNLYPRVANNYDFWEADFTQTLLPTGKVGTLPAIVLASFDTVADQWRFESITPDLTLPGFTNEKNSLEPRTSPGESTVRPILLNLPPATFGVFAIAPFLPFLLGFLKKRLDSRDPEEKERKRRWNTLIANFKSGKGTPEAIDNELLPILRTHLKLPPGATIKEIASASKNEELADLLRTHSEASFSTTAKQVDFSALAKQLAKLSLIFLICFSSLQGATLEEANTAFEESNYREAASLYKELIEQEPNRASLHFNLAQTHFAANAPAKARASCHTALLLDPLDQEARDLMSKIRQRQGDLTVARNRFLDLRPDQWIITASIIWVIAFLYFGLRKFKSIPLWPGIVLIIFSLALLGTAAWRQTHDYIPDQYMVLADELPREPKAGTPDWNYPALRAGQIVQISETNDTHAKVESSELSFWLPIKELQQVW